MAEAKFPVAEASGARRKPPEPPAKAEDVLRVLERRARALHDRVLATSDESILQHWFDRAITAATTEEVFQGGTLAAER